jgi:hypothetical protein
VRDGRRKEERKEKSVKKMDKENTYDQCKYMNISRLTRNHEHKT